ncbi:MAG: hydroxyethylthiazole kinase [Methanomassiliicoccales archaeon]|nr:MAG: hydroxyethylthiazole kinase [Methanomassiliicoccales archaeon]
MTSINKGDLWYQMVHAVELVRKTNPVVGSITNTVTVNFVANAQLAIGGSAAMVYLPDEGEFLAKNARAMYINAGTFLPIYEQTLPRTVKALNEHNRPWVLDPVGIGIGALRTEVLRFIKENKPSVIRGNASEIIALAGLWGLDGGDDEKSVRGVDATDPVASARDAAVSLAKWTEGAVVVSGETDLVTDGSVEVYSFGGSKMMKNITGAGCSLGGVVAVFSSVASPFIAALTGTQLYNLAASRAERRANGPGSFQTHFLDEIYRSSAEEIANNPFEIKGV